MALAVNLSLLQMVVCPYQGEARQSREKILALIREAVELRLQALRERGERAPKPVSSAEYVEV